MAEAENNLILRLLREIRTQQTEDGRRLHRVERRVDELHESAGAALGMAAHANIVTESAGEKFDEIHDQLEALRRRVAELETRQ